MEHIIRPKPAQNRQLNLPKQMHGIAISQEDRPADNQAVPKRLPKLPFKSLGVI